MIVGQSGADGQAERGGTRLKTQGAESQGKTGHHTHTFVTNTKATAHIQRLIMLLSCRI